MDVFIYSEEKTNASGVELSWECIYNDLIDVHMKKPDGDGYLSAFVHIAQLWAAVHAMYLAWQDTRGEHGCNEE